ncbi:hypothetical protein HD806DRAFT_543621 [Xylariaceae sp. AK1471]|nr:hypothetical protein HD806DRAFT_543621 [Xylariaceae sp. AK1471]
MSTPLSPLLLNYSEGAGPVIESAIGSAEVAIVLNELRIPYYADKDWGSIMGEVPEPTIVPRTYHRPSIWDPNTPGITIIMSGAADIVLYLTTKYDTEHRISFENDSEYERERYILSHMMYTKMDLLSNPYLVPEKRLKNDPDAVRNFETAVGELAYGLEEILGAQQRKYEDVRGDGPWLVSDRMTYVDLLFGPSLHFVCCWMENGLGELYPRCNEWLTRIIAREGVLPTIQEFTIPQPLELFKPRLQWFITRYPYYSL